MFLVSVVVLFAQSIEARCLVKNEDVVGVAPTGDAPTTSEWSASLLPTKVRLILEVWRLLSRFHGDCIHNGKLYLVLGINGFKLAQFPFITLVKSQSR